jgi:hypothetical protein
MRNYLPSILPICHAEPEAVEPEAAEPAVPEVVAPDNSTEMANLVKQNESLSNTVAGYKTEIAQLQQTGKITVGERTDLDKRLEQQSAELRTQQELSKKEVEKIQRKHGKDLEAAQTESSVWKQRYVEDFRQRELAEAASVHKPYNPAQVVDFLLHRSEVIEDEPGTFSVKVTFPNPTAGEDPFVLSPIEAVKTMAEAEEHANLFVSPGSAGAFRKPGTGGDSQPSLADVAKSGDFESYKKLKGA